MNISAVIFDRDGVLTYFDMAAVSQKMEELLLPISPAALVERWEKYIARIGFPANHAEEKRFIEQFWYELSRDFDLITEQQTLLGALDYTDYMCAFPDAKAALEICKSAGLRVGVLSNFSLASLEYSLQRVGLADSVDVACVAPMLGAAKPAPGGYRAIAQLLSVEPENCLYFDDKEACVLGAERVGMQAFWMQRSRTDHDLKANIVRDLTTLSTLLKV